MGLEGGWDMGEMPLTSYPGTSIQRLNKSSATPTKKLSSVRCDKTLISSNLVNLSKKGCRPVSRRQHAAKTSKDSRSGLNTGA
jgi:hypothetical protein